VDPKFETLRNRDNCSERRFGSARVFKVEFRIAVAQRIFKWRECVFAEQAVQDQAQRSLSLARRVSRNGNGWLWPAQMSFSAN
jgi:hypothetical protein